MEKNNPDNIPENEPGQAPPRVLASAYADAELAALEEGPLADWLGWQAVAKVEGTNGYFGFGEIPDHGLAGLNWFPERNDGPTEWGDATAISSNPEVLGPYLIALEESLTKWEAAKKADVPSLSHQLILRIGDHDGGGGRWAARITFFYEYGIWAEVCGYGPKPGLAAARCGALWAKATQGATA